MGRLQSTPSGWGCPSAELPRLLVTRSEVVLLIIKGHYRLPSDQPSLPTSTETGEDAFAVMAGLAGRLSPRMRESWEFRSACNEHAVMHGLRFACAGDAARAAVDAARARGLCS